MSALAAFGSLVDVRITHRSTTRATKFIKCFIMAIKTEFNDGTAIETKSSELNTEIQDSIEVEFQPWRQLPVLVAMGLAIFILGLVRSNDLPTT